MEVLNVYMQCNGRMKLSTRNGGAMILLTSIGKRWICTAKF